MTDLTALIERLEAAEEGSRELDGEIAVMLKPGFYPSSDIAEKGAAPYTTSLDTKLPWENIRHVGHDHESRNWMAAHVGPKNTIWGIGKTEPLARRIAALRAKRESD